MSVTIHHRFRTIHTRSTLVTDADKLKRLTQWKHWRRYGLKGNALMQRTKMNLVQVRKWAADVGFDLEGLA